MQQEQMKKCEFFLVSHSFDGERWEQDELVESNPVPRVRELLGGRWEWSAQYMPTVKAFFNGKKRVLVMGFPPEKFATKEQAMAALYQIHEGREDLS